MFRTLACAAVLLHGGPLQDEAGELQAIVAEARQSMDQADVRLTRAILADFERQLSTIESHESAPAARLVGEMAQIAERAFAIEVELVAREWLLAHELERGTPEDDDVLDAKALVGILCTRTGRLDRAVELFEDVYRVRTATLPADHRERLDASHNLAAALSERGDLDRARELKEEVLAARQAQLAPGHPDLVLAQQGLGTMRLMLGDAEGALELFEQVLVAREEALPEGHPELVDAMTNMALALRDLGELEPARDLLEAAYAYRAEQMPPGHPARLGAQGNLASMRYDTGDRAGALEIMEEMHLVLGNYPLEHPDRAGSLRNLGTARRGQGDLDGALVAFTELQRSYRATLPEDHPRRIAASILRTSVLHALERFDEADEAVLEALAGLRAFAAAAELEAPRVGRAAVYQELRQLGRAMSYSSRRPEVVRALFETLECLRTTSTASIRLTRSLAELPELAQIRDELSSVRAQLNDLSLRPPLHPAQLEVWRTRVVEAASKRDALERKLRTACGEAGIRLEPPSTASLTERLPEGGALIAYCQYQRQWGFAEESKRGASEPWFAAFVLTGDGEPSLVDLGPASPIDQALADWRAALGAPIEARGIGTVSEGAPADSESGRLLREKLLDPCLSGLDGSAPTALHIIPDDCLHLLPFDALPLEDGQVLGEACPVFIATSADGLVAEAAAVQDGSLVAFGGVDFAASAGELAQGQSRSAIFEDDGPAHRESGARSMGSFPPLPHTLSEVRALEALSREHDVSKAVILTGPAASRSALIEHAGDARYLHLATHGWFAPEGYRSMLEVEDTGPSLARARRSVRGFVPGSLCGLALAGAGRSVEGLLTAEELSGLDLTRCELAVLSACETNVGIHRAGQGIQSLQAALHAAGARTAVTSLWQVDDAATEQLMETFYSKLWGKRLPKGEALWGAKMALKAAGQPTRNWAAWVLTGDPE